MFGSHSRFSVAVVVDVEALYLDSGEHVGFDTGCGVLADAERRRLTVLDLSNSQEWLNQSLDGRT